MRGAAEAVVAKGGRSGAMARASSRFVRNDERSYLVPWVSRNDNDIDQHRAAAGEVEIVLIRN